MNPKKNARYKFRKAWSWPEDVDRKIRSLCEGFTLHVCNGESTIGDVRIDIEKKAEIRASMYFLPIKPESFDTVLCDPPWELPYHLRGKLLRALRDTLKPGGRLIFNCFWFPKTRGLSVDPEIYVGVPTTLWRNASLLITARRMALQSGATSVLQRIQPKLETNPAKEEEQLTFNTASYYVGS